MKLFPFPSAILALSVWCASAAQAGVTIPNAPVLTGYPVAVEGDLGFHAAEYSASLSSPGTASVGPTGIVFGGAPFLGCTAIPNSPNAICALGTGTISATLGHDPSISLIANPANGAVGDAGYSVLQLVYYVEDVSPTQAAGTTTIVTIKDSTHLSTSGDGGAEAIVQVYGGSLGVVYNVCASEGSNVGVCGTAPTTISAFGNKTINFTYNQVYTVFLQIDANASGPVSASIDPTFVQSGGDGQFEFSPGVTAGVPEPATWAMLLVGFLGLGAAMRTRRAIWSAAR